MPLVYLILIALSFFGARNHLPFVSIPIFLGIILLFLDVINQIIRKSSKKIHQAALLASIAILFISISYAFVWQGWPGAFANGLFGVACGIAALTYLIMAKQNINLRFVCTGLVLISLMCITFMKSSTVLCIKNDIDPKNPKAPIFVLHDLSWRYNSEGNGSESMRILNIERAVIKKKLVHIRIGLVNEFYERVFMQDSAIVENAFQDLSNGNWTYYEPLLPEDFYME